MTRSEECQEAIAGNARTPPSSVLAFAKFPVVYVVWSCPNAHTKLASYLISRHLAIKLHQRPHPEQREQRMVLDPWSRGFPLPLRHLVGTSGRGDGSALIRLHSTRWPHGFPPGFEHVSTLFRGDIASTPPRRHISYQHTLPPESTTFKIPYEQTPAALRDAPCGQRPVRHWLDRGAGPPVGIVASSMLC